MYWSYLHIMHHFIYGWNAFSLSYSLLGSFVLRNISVYCLRPMVHELVVWQYIKTIYDSYYLYEEFARFIQHQTYLVFMFNSQDYHLNQLILICKNHISWRPHCWDRLCIIQFLFVYYRCVSRHNSQNVTGYIFTYNKQEKASSHETESN